MSPALRVILIVIAVLVVLLIGMYILGRKLQKKQNSQQQQIEASKQTYTMLIIDKKKMKLKDANLSANVLSQTTKFMRNVKVPVVKAKVGPQITTLICDGKIFDSIPVKKEVKATVSGIYITEVRALRGQPIEKKPAKKKSRYKRFVEKMQEKAGAKPL